MYPPISLLRSLHTCFRNLGSLVDFNHGLDDTDGNGLTHITGAKLVRAKTSTTDSKLTERRNDREEDTQ